MTGMNSLMLPCSQSEINALYKMIYQCLKSQRTILTHIFESSNNDLNELYKRSLKCILSVGYDSLFQKSSVIFDEINHFLTTNSSIPEDNERIGYTILASLLSINKITSLIRYTTENYFPNSMYDQEQNFNLKMMASSTLNNKERVFKETLNDECLKNISSSKLTNLSDSFNSLATIICRICDREVSLDTIETHSKSCAKAYLSSKTIRTVEDRMRKLQVLAQQTILRVEWPYEEDFSITNIIPILHVIVILDKAIECDSSAKYELTQMVELLNMLKIIPNLKKQKRNFDKAITLIMEKCSLTKELEDALDVVKLTTNNQLVEDYVPTDVTIDEFDFIKKISSGAFSRVYLTRKSQTGDLSATKAIPRTSLKQMNDVQRVLVEKNILSKVTSEYMITFCMYFF
ncbi:hypothetical protein TRFO_33681 [Tritrichomonas foetus]|uniref:non-specific serine/threonine protein kinase n=1 Tax=Tritrichomonas foetus TaxID=1144522 RepID=A0A1J4JL35_9EUKA|nr:hypothetical protein TRFO_33681 [Tritrichomonas foetus]|eukprot:OHS99806.1 hypothetical protein TRFO_33681 [Tritrichomonas foetus]